MTLKTEPPPRRLTAPSLLATFILVWLAPPALAAEFPGFYEDFNEVGFNPTVPSPTPVPWYSITPQPTSCMDADGSILISTHSNTNCGQLSFTLELIAQANTGMNWSHEYDWFVRRDASLRNVGGGFIVAAGGPSTQWTSTSNFRISTPCSTVNIPNSGVAVDGHTVLQYDTTTNTVTVEVTSNIGGSSCSIVNAAFESVATTIVTLSVPSPKTSAETYAIDNWVWNNGNGTFFINETITAAEFDEGLKDFASGLGFITDESKALFAILLIALTIIAMAFLTSFFGEGKWRIWTIHGIASGVGVVCVLLGYTEFWILVVGLVLSTTVVTGGRETVNTFKSLAFARSRERQPQPEKAAATPAKQDAPEPVETSEEAPPEDEAQQEPVEEEAPEPEAPEPEEEPVTAEGSD